MYKLLECALGCIKCCGCGGGHSSIGRAPTDELPAVEEKKVVIQAYGSSL